MEQYVLTAAQWAKMEPYCFGKTGVSGRNGADNRRFMEAVLWVARTGSSWRDLPSVFGKWKTSYVRYRYWGKAGVFQRIFNAVSSDPDLEYAVVEGIIVHLPRHGPNPRRGLKLRTRQV